MEFIDLGAQQARIRPRIEARIAAVLAHGAYIMGPELEELESALSAFCGARHAVTCANGTDALLLALKVLGIGAGDAVFCPSFTFAATAEVVPALGAVPVFVDVEAAGFTLDPASLRRAIARAMGLGLRPAAVIVVDLFGRPGDYDAIRTVADAAGLRVIADAAQSFGSRYRGRNCGTLAEITTTSFFPAKPLGCYGDGGAIFTDDEAVADELRSFRAHGKGAHKYEHLRIGVNSRLDTLQAAILCEKLAIFEEELASRQAVAEHYGRGLAGYVTSQEVPAGDRSAWAQYTLRLPQGAPPRAEVMRRMAAAGVPTQVYYPCPLHRQPAYAGYPADPDGLPVSEALAAEVLSLPMHPYLAPDQQDHVIATFLGAIGRGQKALSAAGC